MNAILHDPDDVAPIPQQATPHSSPRPGLSRWPARWPMVLAAACAAVLIVLLAVGLVAINAKASGLKAQLLAATDKSAAQDKATADVKASLAGMQAAAAAAASVRAELSAATAENTTLRDSVEAFARQAAACETVKRQVNRRLGVSGG